MRARAMSGWLSTITGMVLIAGGSPPPPHRPAASATVSPLRRLTASCRLVRAQSRSCAGTAALAGPRGLRAQGVIDTVEIPADTVADDRREHRGSRIWTIGQ